VPLPFFNYRSREPPRLRFFPEFPEHPRQLALTRRIDQLGGRECLPPIHPHVEWTVLLDAKPSLPHVQLGRAYSQVQQDSVAASMLNPPRQLGEISAA
jgi:hypothetical protein